MCGIFFLKTEDGQEEIVKKHGSIIKHRGPDASENCIISDGTNQYTLCFHRLAIIAVDGTQGMQPIREDNITLICNGEIYNYKWFVQDLTKSIVDVEVIIRQLKSAFDVDAGNHTHLHIEHYIGQLDGDFAFVALVLHNDKYVVVAARDSIGVRPLFMALDNTKNIIGFASEAKALVDAPGVCEIRVFPPGHVCIDGVLSRYDYSPINKKYIWDPMDLNQSCAKSVRMCLERAVCKRIEHSERPVGILCSGGIDSAAVLAIAVQQAKKAGKSVPRVFTMRYGSGSSEDGFYASMLCQKLGCKHDIVTFDAKDLTDETISAVVRACETSDPNTIRAAIPMYLLAKHIATKTDIKVILSGEGADELFGGYGYFRLAPTPEDANNECARLLANLHMFDLLRADRCFAAHGLEVRVPFLDSDLIHHVSSMPPEVRTNGEKQLLRDSVSDIPELVALRILDRPKEKFSDGTGFTYVPDLLRKMSLGRDDGTLSSRLEAEKQVVKEMFREAYGPLNNWVIERRVPSWVDQALKDANSSKSGMTLNT
jgi:asparagine synthase (glutamine-hydrolysing)